MCRSGGTSFFWRWPGQPGGTWHRWTRCHTFLHNYTLASKLDTCDSDEGLMTFSRARRSTREPSGIKTAQPGAHPDKPFVKSLLLYPPKLKLLSFFCGVLEQTCLTAKGIFPSFVITSCWDVPCFTTAGCLPGLCGSSIWWWELRNGKRIFGVWIPGCWSKQRAL